MHIPITKAILLLPTDQFSSTGLYIVLYDPHLIMQLIKPLFTSTNADNLVRDDDNVFQSKWSRLPTFLMTTIAIFYFRHPTACSVSTPSVTWRA